MLELVVKRIFGSLCHFWTGQHTVRKKRGKFLLKIECYLAVREGGSEFRLPIVVEMSWEPKLMAGEHGVSVHSHQGSSSFFKLYTTTLADMS
jgi:hypothetical protein